MKKLRNIITICCLLIAYVYFCNVYYFPSELIVKENSKIEFKLCPFIECIGVIQTDSNNDNTYKIELSIAGIKLKDSKVNIIEDTKLVPVGKMIGLKLYSSGIMIVGISEIEDINGVLRKSINENDIEEGDRILKVNGTTVENIQALKKEINKNLKNIELEVENIKGEIKYIKAEAIKTGEKEYKIGLWVKDAATGVGTMTFYNKKTGEFAALGHGIVDQDSEQIIEIDSGEITSANVVSINKAVPGTPGEIRGSIGEDVFGIIEKNSKFGIFGTLKSTDIIENSKEYEIALRNEIENGDAVILCSLDGKNVKGYKIKINDIYLNNNENNKSFEIEIVDKELVNDTGGIIRGLSRKSNYTK